MQLLSVRGGVALTQPSSVDEGQLIGGADPDGMTNNRTRAIVAGGLVAVTALSLSGSPAMAAEGRDGERAPRPEAKERCTSAIDRRLAALGQMGERARGSGPLTDAHEATVLATTAQQTQGLTGLRAEVQAATTSGALADACRKVVPDYRVFVLTRPKVHLTIGADTLTAASVRLEEAVARLQQAADTAAAAGQDVTAAQAEIDAAKAGAAAVRTQAAPVPDAVLVLEPSGYPANATVLSSSRTTLIDARATLRAAAQDAKDARTLLRA